MLLYRAFAAVPTAALLTKPGCRLCRECQVWLSCGRAWVFHAQHTEHLHRVSVAVWLAVGLWVLLMPASIGARPLSRAAPYAAAFLLAWLLAAYAATTVATFVDVPDLAR